MSSIPVTWAKPNGLRLHGILHPAPDGGNGTAVLILSPGIKNRVAPHRLYVKMARRFVEMGFEVLRFDPEGLGDSEGEIDEAFAADLYGSIQTGRFSEDTISAIDWMERERGTCRVVLAGLCGGAITGLLAGVDDPRVGGLLGLGIPVILDGTDINRYRTVTQGQLDNLKKAYFRKAFRPEAWLRFLSFRTDYRLMLRSVFRRRKDDAAGKAPSAAPPEQDNFNPRFPLALDRFCSGDRRILFVFSQADRLYWEYEEKFLGRHADLAERHRDRCRVHVAKDANHIFSFREWQEDMLAAASAWLGEHFRPDGTAKKAGAA